MRTALFISGRGSNLKTFLDENFSSCFHYVFSDQKAAGLSWARRRGAYTEVLDFKKKKTWPALALKLNTLKIKKIYLLGFMKIVPADFIEDFEGEIFNIHPSLLPDYPGLNSLERTFKDQKACGCSLHRVNHLVDQGDLIFQKKIQDLNQKKFSQFAERVHAFEKFLVLKHHHLGGVNRGCAY